MSISRQQRLIRLPNDDTSLEDEEWNGDLVPSAKSDDYDDHHDLASSKDVEMVAMSSISSLAARNAEHTTATSLDIKKDHLQVPYDKSHHGWWHDFLYPPNLPRSCQLLRKENLAVPVCYLLVGLIIGLSSVLSHVYPLDLGATEAQQTSIVALRSLPASFKLIFGFISDNFPLGGYRRKSYMFVGWLLCSCSFIVLLSFSNLGVEFTEGSRSCLSSSKEEIAQLIPSKDHPSITFLSLCAFTGSTGLWIADVMGDSIVAEKAKLEPPDSRGSVQSTCYSYRFFGSMVAVPLASYLYSAFGPLLIVIILALLPLCIIPFVILLDEKKDAPIASTKDQCAEIYNTVCSRAVWQPMGFIFLFNAMQVTNSAWRQFQRTNLHFTACQLNALLIVAYVLMYLGVISYKYCMIHMSWRKVYIVTTGLNGFFSSLQLLLLMGITFGLSPFFFAMGDDAFTDFIQGIQFLPSTIMMVHLCPPGSEGASYAMFTTVHNSAGQVSDAFSTMLLKIWDVSKTALENDQLHGLFNLTILTTVIQTAALLFVGLLPEYKEDLDRLKTSKIGKSTVGGCIFLAITFCSITYAIVVGFLNILAPGWMGES